MTSNKLREYIMQYTVSSMIGRPSFESHYGMVKNKQYQIKLNALIISILDMAYYYVMMIKYNNI